MPGMSPRCHGAIVFNVRGEARSYRNRVSGPHSSDSGSNGLLGPKRTMKETVDLKIVGRPCEHN
jgi:hypothetical protein